jgi:hypothetical protein
MAELSKTARASMRVETQGVSRTPVAWVFEHKCTMQTRPYKTCYVRGEAEALVAQHPERFYMVVWGDGRR